MKKNEFVRYQNIASILRYVFSQVSFCKHILSCIVTSIVLGYLNYSCKRQISLKFTHSQLFDLLYHVIVSNIGQLDPYKRYKCSALWRAVNGDSATERPLGAIRKVNKISPRFQALSRFDMTYSADI